jgi:anti-sigma regulatory factor (Ser/Thr protein kinase)
VVHSTHQHHPIREREDASGARRALRRYAEGRGMASALVARAELVMTEIATNILGHAGGRGYVLFRHLGEGRDGGVEMIGVDRGPGIDDVARALAERTPADYERMLQDGVRPQGLGAGLGAVRRLSTAFDIFSRPRDGTIVLSRMLTGAAPAQGVFRVGGVSVAMDGFELDSGDGWASAECGHACTAVLVDGLGHGSAAKAASDAALEAFETNPGDNPQDYLHRAHAAMRKTRGGALGWFRIDQHACRVQYFGVGNIEGRILLRERTQGLASRNGTVGLDLTTPSAKLFEYAWEPDAVAIMHSDGIRARLEPHDLRPLLAHDPSIVAAWLHREYARERDDATVVVVQGAGDRAA